MEKKDKDIFQPRRLNDRLVVMKKELELKYKVDFNNISYSNFYDILEVLKEKQDYYFNLCIKPVLSEDHPIELVIQEMIEANKINEEFKFLYSYIFKMRFPEIYKQKERVKKYIDGKIKILQKETIQQIPFYGHYL